MRAGRSAGQQEELNHRAVPASYSAVAVEAAAVAVVEDAVVDVGDPGLLLNASVRPTVLRVPSSDELGSQQLREDSVLPRLHQLQPHPPPLTRLAPQCWGQILVPQEKCF